MSSPPPTKPPRGVKQGKETVSWNTPQDLQLLTQ